LVTLLADLHYKYIIAAPLAIGWINASRAIGLSIGPMFFSRFINEKNLHFFFVLQGLAIIFWAFIQHNFTYSLIGIIVVGLLSTSLWSFTYYLLQKEIESQYLGRVIAYNDMIFMTTNIAVTLFVGYMAKIGMGLNMITIIMGMGFLLTAVYYRWYRKYYG
jgi:hypothetical protein